MTDHMIDHIKAFNLEDLRTHISECPEPTDGSSLSEIIEDSLEWVDTLRNDLIALINGITNDEDVEMAVAIQYVEMKSRWIAFNTKMNYEMFRGETPHPRDMCKAACVSALLGHVEELIEPSDIDTITEFLAEPINKAA